MNIFIIILIGVLIGILLTGLTIFKIAPSVMMTENESKFNFEQTDSIFQAAVKNQGWSISTVHDFQKTMKKFNNDVAAVKVYELCHPDHASKILKNDNARKVSSLMPCRVSIYEKGDKVIVSRMNTGLISKVFGGLVTNVMAQASLESEIMVNSVITN